MKAMQSTTTYQLVLHKLLLGQRVLPEELAQAWRECPTDLPPRILRDFTAKYLELRGK